MKLASREPVVLISAIVILVEATIALFVVFSLQLTPEQSSAIMAVVVAFATVIQIIWVRSKVTPVADPIDNEGRPLRPEGPSTIPLSGAQPAQTTIYHRG